MERIEIQNCCITEFQVETTGFRGGDSGHGGSSLFRIKDHGGTDILDMDTTGSFQSRSEVAIMVRGDAELQNLILGLEWAAKKLREKSGFKGELAEFGGRA